MSYHETVHYLYNLSKHGIKLGLDNIARLLSRLDDPHKSFISVHVAGTNGKGSTSAIIASILQASGLRVGLFTSPHLTSFTERIRINGAEISEDEIVRLTDHIRKTAAGINDFYPTFFEVATALAFLYFKSRAIDIAVLEVGMGGRLDATNIVTPEVSVITNISYDHREFLGESLRQIASEKAGIIKKGVPAVISRQEPEAIEVIGNKAKEENTDLYIYGRDFSSAMKREDLSAIFFDYSEDSLALHDLSLPLIGEHQMQNASVAIKAAKIALNAPDLRRCLSSAPFAGVTTGDVPPLPDIRHIIREGLKNVRWPGRLEFISRNPAVIIDGAHNPAAAAALARTLKTLFLGRYSRIVLVLGIMSDKDIPGIMKPLLPLASDVAVASPAYDRAASPEKLADVAVSLGFPDVHVSPTVRDAIDYAIGKASGFREAHRDGGSFNSNSELIVITGSFYTIGEAKEAFGQKGVLARLRE
jgi:dihydrofolate synthase/folylpolyglutamate synthase